MHVKYYKQPRCLICVVDKTSTRARVRVNETAHRTAEFTNALHGLVKTAISAAVAWRHLYQNKNYPESTWCHITHSSFTCNLGRGLIQAKQSVSPKGM